MAFPASGQVTAEAFRTARNIAGGAKSASAALRNASAAGDVSRFSVIQLLQTLASAIANWNQCAATPGLAAYAQDQVNDPTLNIANEFTAMVNAAISLRDWINTNFPKDAASGAWLVWSFDAAGATVPLTFTTAQLAPFRTMLTAFEATIS